MQSEIDSPSAAVAEVDRNAVVISSDNRPSDDYPADDRFRHHRLMLRLSIAALCLAFLLEVSADGVHVAPRGFSEYRLPETCGAKLLLGAECPGCGLTRSFIWAGRGEWSRAMQANRIGLVVLAACFAQIPYRLFMLRSGRRGTFAKRKWAGYFGTLLIAALIGNWLLKQFGI